MSVCRCTNSLWCSHWTTGPLTQTEFEFYWQEMGRKEGVKPDPSRELWSSWKWMYLA